MNVALFLEDIGHEKFLIALIERVIQVYNVQVRPNYDVKNASGGKARAKSEFANFLRDSVRWSAETQFDLVIPAIDTDCAPFQRTARELKDIVERTGYLGKVVFATPEPHIEAWYLADPIATQKVFAGSTLKPVPAHKCKGKQPKQTLLEAARESGVSPPLGGVEFAEEIVGEMNLNNAMSATRSLKHFIEDLRSAL